MMGEEANFGEASSSAIKKEIFESDSMTGTGNNSKKSAAQRRHFTVNIGGRRNRVVAGEMNSNVLSALMSSEDISNKMAEMKKKKRVPFLIGKTGIEGCINLGMPLKYLPENSDTEMKFYMINEGETADVYRQENAGEEEWILFFVCPVGHRLDTDAEQSQKIIKCKKFENHCNMCVFAPKGETIKDALCKDGRFLSMLNERNWKLVKGENSWDNTTVVDENLDKKIFKVGLKGQQRGTKDTGGPYKEQNIPASHEVKTVSLGTCDVPNKEQAPLVSHKKYLKELPCALKQEYRFFWEQRNIIDSSFGKTRAQRRQKKEFLIACRKEFSKVTKNSSLIKTQKILIKLSESVGYIMWGANRKEGNATCFVLCNRYILTCRHVVNMIVGEGLDRTQWENKISETAEVCFSYEDKHPENSDKFLLEPWLGITDGQLDFAVLRLKEKEKIPEGLVHVSFPPFNGLVYIIGHPDGEAKSMDGCSVVSIMKREQEYSWRLLQGEERNYSNYGINSIHIYTPRSFSDILNDPHKVTYDTTFFCGSSGSPVFDQNGKLVALHTGGYGKIQVSNHSIIEYGFSVRSILLEIEKVDKAWYDSEIAPFIFLPPDCTDVELEECG